MKNAALSAIALLSLASAPLAAEPTHASAPIVALDTVVFAGGCFS
jgi:hypothetical protein